MARLYLGCFCAFLVALSLALAPVAAQEAEPKEKPQEPLPEQPTAKAIQWEPTYDAALKKAKEANKPLFVYLYEPGKKFYGDMETNVFAAPDVIKYTENFICYKEEKKKVQGVTLKFHPPAGAFVVIVSSENEKPLGSIVDYFQWQQFLEKLRAIFDSIAVEKEAEKKLSQSSDDVEANFKLAGVWVIRGFNDQAIQFYEKVVRLDPKNEKGFTVDAALKLAELYLDAGKIDAARKSLKKAEGADPENKKGSKEPCALTEARILAQFENKYDEAITALNNFVKTYPESKLLPDAYYFLGYAYYMKDDCDNAIANWEIIASKFPEHELAEKAKGFIETAKQERDKKKRE
jgi:tetratricopeptide (TPR) repeat protein